MKILYILRTTFGLMGTNASYFIPKEVAKFHDVLVLEGPLYKSEENLIVAEHGGLDIQTINQTEFAKRFVELCNAIDAYKPDIIHVFYHHQALELGNALRRKYGSRIKLLVDIRTPLLEDKFRIRTKVQLKNIWLHRAFDMIATHSLYSVKTIFPICTRPVREVSYGVDYSAFTVRTKGWNKNNIDLVYTGAIAKKRQIEELILAFKKLEETPDAQKYNFKLNFYGSGNRIQEMKALTENLEMSDRVIFHGLIDQGQLAQNLHQNAIGIGYVPFAVYKQAPALKTLEYMCAGLSVLASDTQSTRDLISKGFNLTPYNNSPSSFVEGILRICRQGWDETKVNDNLELAKNYDWKEIVQSSLIPIYQELADQ